MNELPTQQILKFTRVEQIFQINFAIIYVIFILAKYGKLGQWFEIRSNKNSELVGEYIANLEWFQVIQNESIQK
jgi:hypothetical protein